MCSANYFHRMLVVKWVFLFVLIHEFTALGAYRVTMSSEIMLHQQEPQQEEYDLPPAYVLPPAYQAPSWAYPANATFRWPWAKYMDPDKLLGAGAYGVAWLWTMKTGEQCAGKSVVWKRTKHCVPRLLYAEIAAMSLSVLRHPNIVRLYDFYPRCDLRDQASCEAAWCNQAQPVNMLLEPALGGEVNKTAGRYSKGMETMFGMSGDRRLRLWLMILVDSLRGLNHMHQNLWLHRDLKPSNIWEVTKDSACVDTMTCEFVLGDLGFATYMANTNTSAGSPYYSPPEAEWTFKGDIYSLGVTMQVLIAGKKKPVRIKASDELTKLVNLMADTDAAKRPLTGAALYKAEALVASANGGQPKSIREAQQLPCVPTYLL